MYFRSLTPISLVQKPVDVKSRNRLKKETASDGNRRDEILGNAPQSARGFFAVPKVIE